MRFMIGLLLSLTACGGSPTTSSTKARGGDHLEEHRFPAVGKLVSMSGKVCTATAVDGWHVVTTATCLQGIPQDFAFVARGVSHAVASISYHTGWDQRIPERSVNMAVAKLGHAVAARWFPSLAPTLPDRCAEGLAVGFGEELNEQEGHNTGRLKFESLYSVKNGDRWELGGLVYGSGPKGQMACDADEGGPVFGDDGKVVGVLSHYEYIPAHPRTCAYVVGAAYVSTSYYGGWALK